MTFNNFCNFTYTEKLQCIYEEGVYIGKRKICNDIAVIYQLNHFYFEIVYTKYRLQISTIRQSENVSIIAPYLDQIDVQELIKVNKIY